MTSRALAGRVVFVLNEPQDLVNIAGVVRVMKNMGLRRLRLVRPLEFDAYRIEGIAHKTHDVIRRIETFDSLVDAVADCVWVAGATARQRTVKRTGLWAREAARAIVERAVAAAAGSGGGGGGGGPIAVVFGREDRGLSNDDLDLCHALVTIPTDPTHRSLNLQHAAAIIAYEIRLAAGGEDIPRKPPRRRAAPATREEYERLFREAEATLEAVDFFKSHTRPRILRTLREVAHRAALDHREASLLRAMAIETRRFLGRTVARLGEREGGGGAEAGEGRG